MSDSSNRISLFDVQIDSVDLQEAASRIKGWAKQNNSGPCKFVVTPNVDHAVMLQTNEPLQQVYRDAHLVLADGFPLIVAAKICKKPLPERVAGSELVPELFSQATVEDPLRVYLLGAAEGVAERAAQRIHQQWPGVKVVGTYSPPMGFEKDDAENENILAKIAEAKPEVLVVGLGAPKQELWVHRFYDQLDAQVALCVGATIDFLAGEKAQAPVWMRKSGLEWMHRVMTEPKRLAKRYAKDAVIFPQLLYREWRTSC